MKLYLAIGELTDYRISLFSQCKARNVLISFADIDSKSRLKLPFEDVMMDSGAYSAKTKGFKISLEAYSLWLQLYLQEYPQIKHYINLDDLDDPSQSVLNFNKLLSDGLSPMPVYHYGESEEILKSMCLKNEYIGLGGLAVGTMDTRKLKSFWEMVYVTYKDNKFHILGVGTMRPFHYYQPYSIDSTSWLSRHGEIIGYKDKLPGRVNLHQDFKFESFFTYEELLLNNIRATIDWEKLEWLKNVPPRTEQGRLEI